MTTAICGRCRAWVNPKAWRCHQCGRLLPALLGGRRGLDGFFSGRSHARLLLGWLIAAYLLQLLISQFTPEEGGQAGFALEPSNASLARFGALLGWHWTRHEPWRIVSAMLLHGGLLHIFCNGSSLLTAGAFVEGLWGPARFWIVFTLSGIAGNVAMMKFQPGLGVGASGGLFGLLGAMLGWGLRRGGVWGLEIRRQTGRWLIYGVIMSFLPGIGWSAHFGGGVAGFLLTFLFAVPDRRAGRESDGARFVALGCVALLVVGFALALWGAYFPRI